MKTYSITIKAETTYEIEAEDKEMALDKAFEFWEEYEPSYSIEEVTEDN